MKKVTLQVKDYLYEFYQKVGQSAGGLPPEKVMADALYRLAGGLSLNAMQERAKKEIFTQPDRGAVRKGRAAFARGERTKNRTIMLQKSYDWHIL